MPRHTAHPAILAALALLGCWPADPAEATPEPGAPESAAPETVIPAPVDLARVNGMDRDAFVSTFGGIFEHSPWVAERAWAARPFANRDALHAAMVAAARTASAPEIVALLNAHPELAGPEARARQMTTASVSEQGSAGLDRMSPAEFDRFDRLNAAYRARFGFPFIIAVRGRGRAEILREFERRLADTPDAEREAALDAVAAITRMRLERRVAPSP